jgi:hypothetical protein
MPYFINQTYYYTEVLNLLPFKRMIKNYGQMSRESNPTGLIAGLQFATPMSLKITRPLLPAKKAVTLSSYKDLPGRNFPQ